MAHLTLFNIGICMIVALGSFAYGFGFGVFITAIGEPGFYIYFNLDPLDPSTANIIGGIQACFAAGAAFGAIAQGWIGDWLGRKRAIAVAGLWALIGGALTTASVNIAMLITTRILHGFGLGMMICLVPLYITEVAPPRRRGVMTGITCLSFGLGYVACAFISLGTYQSKNLILQWRMPLGLSCVGPLALLIGVPFVPETPRYLTWIGKNEEAWKVIQRIHHDPKDHTDRDAQAEFTQIVRQVEHDRMEKAGYVQMFTKPSWRRRSLLVMFIMFASQATGVNGISTYLVVIFSTLNLTGQMPLVIYAIYAVVGTIAACIAIFSIDLFGRRRLFLIGFPILACDLLVEALLQWKFLATTNKGGNIACVVFIFLFIVLFQFIDAPSFVWSSEVFPTTIRAKGIGLTMFAYFVGFITFSTPGPLGFKNIQWHMYLIYMGLSLVCWLLVYLWLPETRRLPLEEIGGLFGDTIVLHLTANGHHIVETDHPVSESVVPRIVLGDSKDVEVDHKEEIMV